MQLAWLIFVMIYPASLLFSVASLIIIPIALFSNVKRIVRYTPLTKVRVASSVEKKDAVSTLLTVNVLQTNKYKDDLIADVISLKPDIVLALETDVLWDAALRKIENIYPYIVSKPQDNLYGMTLLSKHPLRDVKIRNIVKCTVPSIDCIIDLNGFDLRFFGIHPEPPSPTEQATSVDRDAELLRLASEIREIGSSVMVSGDLNDVIWSRTTELFTKESGLLDPRVGRGFFATFSAKLPRFLRFPVDQLYHTRDICCSELQTLKVRGSDHLGILYSFSTHQDKQPKSSEKKLSADEKYELESSKNREEI